MKNYRRSITRTFCFLLCLCLLIPIVASCGDKDSETGSIDDTVDDIAQKTVAVVLPVGASDEARKIASNLRVLCEEAGYAVEIKDDPSEDHGATYALLVGNVGNDISEAHYSELGTCGYGIKIDGNTLSLAGTGDLMLNYAYSEILENGFSSEGGLLDAISSENTVYDELLWVVKSAKMELSISGDSSVSAALSALKNGLASIIKKSVASSDGESGDVVVLSAERAREKGIVTDIGYNEFGIISKDSKIYIYSANEAGLVMAVDEFCSLMADISNYKESRGLFWPAELGYLGAADKNAPRLPYLNGAEVYDAAISGSYTLTLTAEKQQYLDYAELIASNGYRLAEDRTKNCSYIGDSNIYTNIYRTYINDDYMVHMYFMDYKNTVKVIGASISEYEGYAVCEATDGDVESTFSMLDIGARNTTSEYVANGLCLAIRLSDGRFVVVDGGQWYGADTKASEVTRLYEWLVSNSPDGKVVIAAWIFTHIHVDHVNVAWKFEQMYGSNVTIECYMHNFVECDYLLSVEGTDLDRDVYQGVVYPRMKNMLKKYDNAIMHTGQVWNIGNAEIEILYTHEDFYPEPLKIANNTSTIMKITIEGNTILVAGDAEEAAQLVALNNNGYTLASNFVQMTHHGFNGLVNYYRYAASGSYTVALCPNYGAIPNRSANNWLKENCEEIYNAGKIQTFVLPYKK